MNPESKQSDAPATMASQEKEVRLAPAEKEVAVNDGKQVLDRTEDTSKEVGVQRQWTTTTSGSEDTEKIFVPQAPPISMEKEVSMPIHGEAQAIVRGSDYDKFPLRSQDGSSTSKRKLFAAFRLEKKHNLGLIWYQSQQIACRAVDLSNGVIGPAAFVTTSMSWTEVVTGLPPMFELMVPGGQFQVARFVPEGLQGLVSMRGFIESLKPGSNGEVERWSIKRRGLAKARQYELVREGGGGEVFVWKGSTETVAKVYGELGAEGVKVKHGSFKLVCGEREGDGAEILAVYNQWRDSETLGDLAVLDGVKAKISVEAVVSSALVVIHAERATGLNWIGGIGK
jgi:hypothetical protein